MKKRFKSFSVIALFFIIINALLLAGGSSLQKWGIDQDVVLLGNGLLFGVTLISYLLAQQGLNSTNPHAFVRSVNSSIVMKLFVCAIAAFIYISIAGNNLNKPALFTCMGLYLVYMFMEVSILTRLLRNRKP